MDHAKRCPVCSAPCSLLDVVDFNKSCLEAQGERLPLSGTPVYFLRCPDCGFCYAPEFAAWTLDDFEARIYNEGYAEVDPDARIDRPTNNAEALQALFEGQSSALRHLDYGGGDGTLSGLLRDQGWDSAFHDPFLGRDWNPEPRGPFNLVTAFEVFANVPDVQVLMEQLSNLLVEDGIILLTTMLSDGHLSPEARLTWWYAAPRNGHICLFSKESLSRLAGQWGFHCTSLTDGLHVLWRVAPTWASHLIDPLLGNSSSVVPCNIDLRKKIRIRHHQFFFKKTPNGSVAPFDALLRIGDLVAMMICAQYKKIFEDRAIVFQLLDDTHKSMRAEILFGELIDELRMEEGPNYDFGNPAVPPAYDPGPLWVAATYYHNLYGGTVIPRISLDPTCYTGPELPKESYVVFHPLFDPTYNKPRGMEETFVNELCLKLHAALGERLLVVTDCPEKIRPGIRTISSNNLYDLAYLIGHATVHLGGDTGFTHLAAAERVPHLFALYGHNYTNGFPQQVHELCYSGLVNPLSALAHYWGTGFDCRPKHDPATTMLHFQTLEKNSLPTSVMDTLVEEVKGALGV